MADPQYFGLPSYFNERITAYKGINATDITTEKLIGNVTGDITFSDGSIQTSLYTLIPQSSVVTFHQAAAPTGWTKITTHNDKSLRVVSGTGGGSGGSVDFSTVFTTKTPSGSVTVTNNSFTISNSEMPAHTHEFGADDQIAGQGGYTTLGNFAYDANSNTAGGGVRLRTRTDTAFGGGSHTHNNTANFSGSSIDFSVKYIDIILCSKD